MLRTSIRHQTPETSRSLFPTVFKRLVAFAIAVFCLYICFFGVPESPYMKPSAQNPQFTARALLQDQILAEKESQLQHILAKLSLTQIEYERTKENMANLRHQVTDTMIDRINAQDGKPQIVKYIPKVKRATIFIAVLTSFNGHSRRQAIRDTWMKQAQGNDQIIVKFVLADKKYASQELLKNLNSEAEEFGDMIFVPSREGYKAIGERLLPTLLAAYQGWDFDYFLKTDDDVYIQIPKLIVMANELPDKLLYWGNFIYGNNVDSDMSSKWLNREYFDINTKYPTYAVGAGYIVTRDIVEWLVTSSMQLKYWYDGPEDSQFGTWLSVLNIKRSNKADAFFGKGITSENMVCSENVIFIHGLDTDDQFLDCHSADARGDLCTSHFVLTWKDHLIKIQKLEQEEKARSAEALAKRIQRRRNQQK